MIELKQMQYFVISAELGSISKAALVLKTNQPIISKLIKSMEDELQVKLFRRNGRGIALTEEGKKVYERAKTVLEDTEKIYDSMQPKNRMELKLCSNPSGKLATVFAKFYQERQDVTVQFLECDTKHVIENVAGGISELGFVFVERSLSSVISYYCASLKLTYTELMCNPLCVNVGKKSPFYGKKSISPEELRQLKTVQTDVDLFSLNEHLEKDKKNEKIDTAPMVVTNGDHVLIQMLLHTDLCYVGSPFMTKYYDIYDIWALPVENLGKTISFGYLQRQNHTLSRSAEDFLEYLSKVGLVI